MDVRKPDVVDAKLNQVRREAHVREEEAREETALVDAVLLDQKLTEAVTQNLMKNTHN